MTTSSPRTITRIKAIRLSALVLVLMLNQEKVWQPVLAQDENASATHSTGSDGSLADDAPGRFSMPPMNKNTPLLHGQVSTFKGRSPILPGTSKEIPEGTKVDLVVPDGITVNSEVSRKGDEILVRIANDITRGERVIIPGGWYMRGLVTDARPRKRGGCDGYVEVQVDKLVSPDGDYELPFDATFSTKDNKIKSVFKVVGADAGYVAVGGAAGALLSVQLGGIGTAIMTHGISVGVGAAAGGTIGLIGALKRKGKVASFYSGDVLKLTTAEPVTLPAFDPALLPSKKPAPHLEGLDLTIKDYHFAKPDWGDKSARLLQLDLDVANNTKQYFHFFDLQVISDHGQRYMPTPFGGFANLHRKVAPGTSGSGQVTFTVDSPKRKYYLIFLSRRTGKELTRVAIN